MTEWIKHYGQSPEPGIYVRGLWVEEPFIPGTVMSLGTVPVTGRDRNSVNPHHVKAAFRGMVIANLEKEILREALRPLLEGCKEEGCRSWLFPEDDIENGPVSRCLEEDPSLCEDVREKVFGFEAGTIFVREEEKKDEEKEWMIKFICDEGKDSVVPVGQKALDFIFPIALWYELTSKCLAIFEKGNKKGLFEREERILLGFVDFIIGKCNRTRLYIDTRLCNHPKQMLKQAISAAFAPPEVMDTDTIKMYVGMGYGERSTSSTRPSSRIHTPRGSRSTKAWRESFCNVPTRSQKESVPNGNSGGRSGRRSRAPHRTSHSASERGSRMMWQRWSSQRSDASSSTSRRRLQRA